MPGTEIESVAFQRGDEGFPLDDIIVQGHHNATLQIQVKRSIGFSRGDAVFKKVVGQIVEAVAKPGFWIGRNELAVATARSSRKIDGPYQDVLRWARQLGSAEAFFARLGRQGTASDDMRAFVDTFRQNAKDAGGTFDDEMVWKTLQRLQILVFDYAAQGSVSEELARERAARVLPPERASDAPSLWSSLIDIALAAAADGGDLNYTTLISQLRDRTINLRGASRFASVRSKIAEDAAMALATMPNRVSSTSLARTERVSAINTALDSGRYVEIRGDAGVGKSGLLRHFAELFQAEGRIIVLSPGRTPQRGWPALRAQLGFDGTARELLLDLATDGGAVLVIDNLDSFDGAEQLTVDDLVRQAATVPGVSVLATARRNFGVVEPNWLDPDAIKALQPSPPVIIDELTPAEIAELSAAEPRLATLLDEAHPARDVVRNLYRLGRLALRDPSDPAPTTEVDMAEQWWKSADGRYDALHRERARVLRHLARLALDGTFAFDVTNQPAGAVSALVASESLRDLGNDRVTFYHDVLRQWAIGNLLNTDDSSFAELSLTKPAPEVVSQGVELAARFLIERQKDDTEWLAMLARMSGPGTHQSWRRATLLAPVHSDVASRLLDQESGRLLENEAALLREMILTVMAVDVVPASQLLVALGVDPVQVPKSFFAPTATSWSHLARWLLGLGTAVPAKALSDVVSFYANFLQGTFGYAPMAREMLASIYAWLVDLEDSHYDAGPGKTFAGKVDYRQVDALRDKLRTVFCLFSSRVPALATEYLSKICALDHDHGAVAAIIKFRGTLAQAAPKELASLTARKLIAQIDKRDISDSLDFREPFHYLDSDFLPPSPAQGPFFELLVEDPAVGMALIRQLVDHAILYQTAGEHPDDNGFRLEFDGKERFFPWGHSYAWPRGNNNFHAMSSGLMALEAWAHRRIEAGDDVIAVLKDVFGPPGSCAAYLLIAVDIVISHWPKTRAAAVPFLSCPELLSADRSRQAYDGMREPDIFGFSALQKEPSGKVLLADLKRRPSRALPLEYLLGYYALSDDDGLRKILTINLQSSSKQLGAPELDSTFADPRLMARYAINFLDPANWHDQVVTQPDGSTQTMLRYVSPEAEANHIAQLQEASSQRFTDTTIAGSLFTAMDDAARSSPELVARGVAWAREAIPSEPDEYDRDGSLRDNAIRGAALILLRDGSDDLRKEHGCWAEETLMTAKASPDNASRMRQELSFNPLGTAFAGLAELYRRDPTSGRLRALLEIATDKNPAGARGFVGTVSGLATADERIPKAITRCALTGVVHPLRYWRKSEEDTALAGHIAAAKVRAIDAEIAWIEGSGPEPEWPDLSAHNVRSRVRPRRYIRIGADRGGVPAGPIEVEPEVLIDDQAAGLWLSALDPVLDAERRPWLRELATAYAEFSAKLNGFGLEQDSEIDQPTSEWNQGYYRLLAHAIIGLSASAIDELALQWILPLPDEPFFEVAPLFLRAVDVIYFNKQQLVDDVPRIRQQIATRLSSTWSWRREVGSRSGSVERYLASGLAAIFFNDYSWVGQTSCYLVPKVMDRTTPFLPALVSFLENGSSYFVANVAMNWLEVAPQASQIPVLTTAARAWLTSYNDDTVRIPVKPAIDSETKPATYSDFIPASIPI